MDGTVDVPRCFDVDGPAIDCSDQEAVWFELEVRLAEDEEGIATLDGGSNDWVEYLIIDCCSTHSAVRSRLALRECSMLIRTCRWKRIECRGLV